MKRSTDRILATHAGALPRPDDLKDWSSPKRAAKSTIPASARQRLRESVAEVVRKQIECGIDVVNDGELGKTNFTQLRAASARRASRSRARGPGEAAAARHLRPATRRPSASTSTDGGRHSMARHAGRPQVFCVEPLRYVGHDALARRHRQPQGGRRRPRHRGRVHEREHARHDRALAAQRATTRRTKTSCSRSPR